MSKIKPFQSPFNYLAHKIPFLRSVARFYYQINKFDDPDNTEGVDPRTKGNLSYLLGGFNPLIAMGKDFIDTFKPFKSGSYYVQRDLMQPLRGIGNTLRGIFNIIASGSLLVINTFRYAYIAIEQRSLNLFLSNMGLNLAKTIGGLLNGVFSIVRGLSQIVTTPATWFLRMPLRAIISCIKGRPTFVDSFKEKALKLETLIKKDDKNEEDTIAIDRVMGALPFKIKKALKRGQNLGASQKDLIEALGACRTFTNKRLSIQGVLQGQSGFVDASSYVFEADADEDTCKTALRFLSIFTKSPAPSVEEIQNRSGTLERFDFVSGRKYL